MPFVQYGPALSCTCGSSADDDVIVALHGEIDMASAPLLRDLLDAAQELEKPVILDMSGVSFLDSSGIKEILRGLARGPVRVSGASTIVQRCLQLTGLADLLDDGCGSDDAYRSRTGADTMTHRNDCSSS